MKQGRQLGLDELMIVNPSSLGAEAMFLADDGTVYQVQGLGEDGSLYKVQGFEAGGSAAPAKKAIRGAVRARPRTSIR